MALIGMIFGRVFIIEGFRWDFFYCMSNIGLWTGVLVGAYTSTMSFYGDKLNRDQLIEYNLLCDQKSNANIRNSVKVRRLPGRCICIAGGRPPTSFHILYVVETWCLNYELVSGIGQFVKHVGFDSHKGLLSFDRFSEIIYCDGLVHT